MEEIQIQVGQGGVVKSCLHHLGAWGTIWNSKKQNNCIVKLINLTIGVSDICRGHPGKGNQLVLHKAWEMYKGMKRDRLQRFKKLAK